MLKPDPQTTKPPIFTVASLIAELQKMPQDWLVNLIANNQWAFPNQVEARSDNEDRVVIISDEGGQ